MQACDRTLVGRPLLKPARVVVALSGGVDSAVAAALLKEQGHDVIGVTLALWPSVASQADDIASCGPAQQAHQVADALGIPHVVLDMRELFLAAVVDPFCREYSAGRTPNPCVVCNTRIKFGALLDWTLQNGRSHVATGHYARLQLENPAGWHRIARAADKTKDQTYFLSKLSTVQLSHALFPLGSLTKPEVRHLAAEKRLPVAQRAESQDACFVSGGDCGRLVADRLPGVNRPGPIVDLRGQVLGTHRGLAYYTVGQRRGLGISGNLPAYVVELDVSANRVIVGHSDDLYCWSLVATDVQVTPGVLSERPSPVTAQVRYRSPQTPALANLLHDGRLAVHFDAPQRAVAIGQTIALYSNDLVVAGGTISEVHGCQRER